jgi:hypothetical protein
VVRAGRAAQTRGERLRDARIAARARASCLTVANAQAAGPVAALPVWLDPAEIPDYDAIFPSAAPPVAAFPRGPRGPPPRVAAAAALATDGEAEPPAAGAAEPEAAAETGGAGANFCHMCGEPRADGARFCDKCGARLE